MKHLRASDLFVLFLFTLVTIETANGVTLPAVGVSTSPPVVFDRTPSNWKRGETVWIGGGGLSRSINTNLNPNSVILRDCPASLPIFINTCDVNKYTCDGRCGDVYKDTDAPPTAKVSCSCDILCTVYGDCCSDFEEKCPSILAEFEEKLGHFRGLTSTCTEDGYLMVDSCPPEPPMVTETPTTSARPTTEPSNSGFSPPYVEKQRSIVRGDDFRTMVVNSTANTPSSEEMDGLASNSSANSTDASPLVPGATTMAYESSNKKVNYESTTKAPRAGGTSRFSDTLVVTDPETGIVYTNQSILACNRNMTLRMRGDDASMMSPILWSRRMFVESTVVQPQQAVEFENKEVISWLDYPPPEATPRHCANRFQLSCYKHVDENACWFTLADSMVDFCLDVRHVHANILSEGNRISSVLLEKYKERGPWGLPEDLNPSDTSNSSVVENGTTYYPVEFPANGTNASCTLRNFKTVGRSSRGSMSFSLTMALNHETGVFVLSNENPLSVNWEKIQCRMEGSGNGLEPICDKVYCSTGYFYAPGFAATSACLKPDLLEISFIFRGIDSATLAKILDLIQAASVYYGPGINVDALGGFVDMEKGNMAYTDLYRINNISITDASDRIPSTLALVESLRDIDVGERSRFPATIQLCFVFREISLEPPYGDAADEDATDESLLFTQKEKVQSRCDVVYLHARSVHSRSLHRTSALETGPVEEGPGIGLVPNGATAHDKRSVGKLLVMAAAVLLGVLKIF